MVQRKEKFICKLFRAGRRAQATRYRRLRSDHYAAQTHVQPRAEIWTKTISEEAWQAVVSLCCAQVSGGHAKPPSAPATYAFTASITQDAAKPSPKLRSLLRPGCTEPRTCQAASPLGKSSTLHHPLFSSPLLSVSLPKAWPLGLPERGGPERLDFLPGITRTR